MNYEQIPGWFDWAPLIDAMVLELPDNSTIAEVGCYMGKSTIYVAKKIKESGKRITFYAIDHGFGSPGGLDYHLHQPTLSENGGNWTGKLIHNLSECNVLDTVIPLPISSIRAADHFRDSNQNFDFVFIDAAHDYESVKSDVKSWWPLIKNGGVLAGHDYDICWPSVCRAVDECFGIYEPVTTFSLKNPVNTNCWSVKK